MSLPQITFVEGQGGLGRALPSNDHISALLFYTGTLPSGFATTSVATRCKALYSLQDAVTAGILGDFSDATAATGKYTVSTAGATGDTIEIFVTDLTPYTGIVRTLSLGKTTLATGSPTTTTTAAEIAATINAGTATHGYTASAAVAVCTITAPKSQGAYLNSGTPLTATISGTIAGAFVQFGGSGMTAGVTSVLMSYYYHVAEFFRMQPKGKLWVGFFAVPGTYTYTEITDMQNNSLGEIRQIGIYKNGTWASGDLSTINTICNTNKTVNYQPLQAIYAANLQATTDITTVTDLSTLTYNNVLNLISQDGQGLGAFYYKSLGSGIKSITNLGTVLGSVALRKVSESIGWVAQTNISNGKENEVPAFSNGQLVSALSVTALNALDTKRHVFGIKYIGVNGTYWNGGHMAVSPSSDYAYMEDNRTICKCERLLYAALIPFLNSPIVFNSNGTLKDTTVAQFETVASSCLDQMVRDGELSDKKATVDPSQNVLSTNTLTVSVKLVKNGVARNISVPIGFNPSIS